MTGFNWFTYYSDNNIKKQKNFVQNVLCFIQRLNSEGAEYPKILDYEDIILRTKSIQASYGFVTQTSYLSSKPFHII